MRPYVLLSLLAIPLAAACAVQSGSSLDVEPGTQPPTASAEEQFFNANVKTAFELNCANCHANTQDGYGAPDFLGAAPEAYYGSLVQRLDFVSCDVGNSMLLMKGADPGHSGVPLAPADVPKVQQWLEMEAEARFGGVCEGAPPEPPPDPETTTTTTTGTGTGTEPDPGPQPLNGKTAMETFGDCMSYTDWIDTGMYLVANEQALYNNNNTECYNCHTNKNTGLNYMPDPDDTAKVMDAFQTMRYMYSSFNLVRWTVNDTDGSFKDLVKSYRWRDKGVEGGDHPPYELSAEYVASYESWFQLTYDRWKTAMESGTPCDAAAGDPPQ